MEILLNFFATFLAVYLALQLHRTVEVKREKGEPIFPVFSSPLEEKAEFLPPMDEEEYDAYEKAQSERGGLLRKVLAKAPWASNPQKSQSSDSSSKTE